MAVESGSAFSILSLNEGALSNERVDALRQMVTPGNAVELSRHYMRPASWNPQEAFSWAQKAESQGNPEGKLLLGVCYYEGVGTERDAAKAARCFEELWKMGDTRVLKILAYMYAEGVGVKQDSQRAMSLVELASELGLTHAAENHALYYIEGKIVPRNLDKAREIISAQLKNNPDDGGAWYMLAKIMNEDTTSSEDGADVIQTLIRAADLGEEKAYVPLIQAYYHGLGVAVDYAKAASYMKKAADAGVPDALTSLATFYYKGCGLPQDAGKAKELWRLAILENPQDAVAHRNLAGAMIETESPLDASSLQEVESMLLKAAEWGDLEAARYLAEEYASDEGLFPANKAKAQHYSEVWKSGEATEIQQQVRELLKEQLHQNPTEAQIADAEGLLQRAAALRCKSDAAALHCHVANHILRMNRREDSSLSRAYAHYTQAAELKYPYAVYRLGRAWEEGWAFKGKRRQPANQDKAAQYYMQAIELGSPEAGAALVRLNQLGYTGVELSLETWLQLMKRAADAGVKGCAATLAAYYHPLGGHQSQPEISARWMKMAVERDATPWAVALRGWMLISEQEETPSPANMRRAARLFRKAADAGDALALVGLGFLHLLKDGPLPYDAGRAIDLFRQAARQGESQGAEMIAEMCAEGIGVKKDWWLARKWYRYARSIEYQQSRKRTSMIQLDD